MTPTCLINADGSPTPTACDLLHAVSDVPLDLLQRMRIRRASDNWLHAPWYRYERGGAITIGASIYFTRKWFAPDGYGDGSIASTWKWMLHLAHEVGHLPQAERFGLNRWGQLKYIMTFTGQYAWRAIAFRHPVHDGSPLEIEADMGRWVLLRAIGADPLVHPVVRALQRKDAHFVAQWCAEQAPDLAALRQQYREAFLP